MIQGGDLMQLISFCNLDSYKHHFLRVTIAELDSDTKFLAADIDHYR